MAGLSHVAGLVPYLVAASAVVVQSARADILYVDYSRGGGIVERIDSIGNRSPFTSSSNNGGGGGFATLLGLAFDSTGNLYASRGNSSAVQKFSTTGSGTIITATKLQGEGEVTNLMSNPVGIALDQTGNVYVADHDQHKIVKIAPDGTSSVFATVSGDPDDLAFDRAGNLFVSTESGPGIEKITPAGVRTTFAGGSNITGLAFDASGNLFAAFPQGNTIYRYTPDGKQSLFASTDLSNPGGLAFDLGGNLYVANVGGAPLPNAADQTIARFAPDGTGSIFVSGLTNYPLYLAFTDDAGVPLQLPIPEPATAALAACALGTSVVRRKMRRPYAR
jgi:sugar lactone lactonase YvrE